MEVLPTTTTTEIFKLPSSPSPSPRFPATFLCQNPTFPDRRRCLYSGVSLVSIAPSLMRSSSPPPIGAVERSHQGNSGGSGLDKALLFQDVSKLTKPLLDFTLSNFLPIALTSAVAIGMVNPALGCCAHKYSLSRFGTFGIFFISGLKLKGKDIGAAAEAWTVGVFGLASILLVGPFVARLIWQVQLAPQEFVTGMTTLRLALFSCMPATLSSGVALTQLVGGNSALALTLTVTSNLLGIITVFHSQVARHISQAGFDGKQSTFAKKENARPLLLVCSQKALLIVAAVVEQLSGALDQSGLVVLPCVATHINQVIIDSFLVNFFLRKDKTQKKDQEILKQLAIGSRETSSIYFTALS